MSVEIKPLHYIKSNRSMIETRQTCKRKRFLSHHYNGIGVEKVGNKYEAAFGTLVHEALAASLMLGGVDHKALKESIKALEDIIHKMTFPSDEHLRHLVREQTSLLCLLVHGWCRYRMPSILAEYGVESVEQEKLVTFHPQDYLPANIASLMRPLALPLRCDAVLKKRDMENVGVVLDWKTTSRASDDWETALSNSLQSNLYIAASEVINPHMYWDGIAYEGLVKGRREVDKSKSSPFCGMVIQYGSFLYGWKKNGEIRPYVNGASRVFLIDECEGATWEGALDYLETVHQNMREYFPNVLPHRPMDHAAIVAQQIMAENSFTNDVEDYEQIPSPMRWEYQTRLFEQTLSACHKYGLKHPCEFVDVCHGGLDENEIVGMYQPRVDHHGEQTS